MLARTLRWFPLTYPVHPSHLRGLSTARNRLFGHGAWPPPLGPYISLPHLLPFSAMLAPRYLYFFCFAALAAPGRFSSVFFRWLGMSDTQIGVVMSLPTILSIASAVLGGLFADSSTDGKRKTMLAGATASTLFFQGIFAASTFLSRHSPLRIVTIAALYTLSRAVRYPSMSALDAYTLEFLVARYGKTAKKRYGEERLWGAVSWGVASIVIGIVLDRDGFNSLFVFNFVASLALTASLLDLSGPRGFEALGSGGSDEVSTPLAVTKEPSGAECMVDDAFRLNDDDNCEEDWREDRVSFEDAEAGVATDGGTEDLEAAEEGTADGREQTFSEFMVYLLSRMDSLAFLFTMACISVGTTQVEGLYFLFLNDIGSSSTLLGFSVAVTVIFEVPLFFFGDALATHFSGRSLLLMGMGFYVLRVLYYTLITKPWMVLLVEPLHGVTFSFVQMAAVLEMSRLGPPNLQTTAQSVLSVSRMIGSVFGTIGGGFLMEKYGAATAYRASAALVTASAALYAWTTRASSAVTGGSQEALLSQEGNQ